jgi:ABC-2 type transport system permease protein
MSTPANPAAAQPPDEQPRYRVSVLSMAAFEWKLVRAERVLLSIALLCALGTAYAAANGRSWVRFEKDALEAARAEEATRLATLARTLDASLTDTSALRPFGDPRNPFVAGQGPARRYATLPPAPLAPLVVGQSDLFPSYYRVGITSRETFFANDEIVNPAHLAAGRFDLAFVIVYIFPLLVLALGYDLISAEREAGTLALVLSQPVRLRTVMAAKLLTRMLLVIGIGAALPIAGAILGGVTVFASDAATGLAACVAIVAAYGAFWFAVALVVNAFGRASAANALAVLGVWLVLVVLAPSGLNLAVTALHPTPSRVELMQATREASNTATARGSQLLAMYFQDHPELMRGAPQGAAEFATRSLVVADEVAKATRPVAERFDSQLDAQQALVDRWRWVSPALVTHVALTDVTGTGTRRYRDFQRQADGYVTTLRAFYEPLVTSGERFTSRGIGRVPEFSFEDHTLPNATADAWRAAGLLGALSIVMAGIALGSADGRRRSSAG